MMDNVEKIPADKLLQAAIQMNVSKFNNIQKSLTAENQLNTKIRIIQTLQDRWQYKKIL